MAFLGGLHPVGIFFAGLFMALVYVGGDIALVSAGIPASAPVVFQGLLLVFYLASYFFVRHEVRRVPQDARLRGAA